MSGQTYVEETSALFFKEHKSELRMNGDSIVFNFTDPMPNWWWRMWYYLLLGWRWKEVKD